MVDWLIVRSVNRFSDWLVGNMSHYTTIAGASTLPVGSRGSGWRALYGEKNIANTVKIKNMYSSTRYSVDTSVLDNPVRPRGKEAIAGLIALILLVARLDYSAQLKILLQVLSCLF